MSSRAERLYSVYQKFLSETLKPLSPDELSKYISGVPKERITNISRLLIPNIERNCLDELEEILNEKNMVERLNKLDELVENSTKFEVDMSAFDFEERDPDEIQHNIVCKSKKQEILKLKKVLENLTSENEKMNNINDELDEKLMDNSQKIQNTIFKIQELLEQ